MDARTSLALAFTLVGCNNPPPMDMPDMAPDLAQLPDLLPPPDLTPRDPTMHPLPPEMDNHGGPVLSAPDVWTIVWPVDATTGSTLDKFTSWMLTSNYWTQSLAEYGVGAGKSNGVITMQGNAPMTINDSDFLPMLDAITAQPMYAPDRNSLYVFLIPYGVNVFDSQGGSGCGSFLGYHSAHKGHAYAVVMNCTGSLDDITFTYSHEAAEAATDPQFFNPGWYSDAFMSQAGGEVGDLCNELNTIEGNFVVTRIYSGQAAMMGNVDPCLPAPTDPYFNAALDPSVLTIATDAAGEGSATIKLDYFAYGNVGTISWFVDSYTPGVAIEPAMGSGHPGDQQTLTIKVGASALSGDTAVSLRVRSSRGGDNEWWGTVTVQ
jgi:hypothetical protein